MRANSDDNPTSFTKSRNKLFFNSNIVQSEKTDGLEKETRIVFDYDVTEVTEKNKTEIMASIEGKNLDEDLQEFKASKEHLYREYLQKKEEGVKTIGKIEKS